MSIVSTGSLGRGSAQPPERDDQDLRDRILRKLAKSEYYCLRKLLCDVSAGVPTLRGRVPSYFLKQVAQAVVVEVARQEIRVRNQIEVVVGRNGDTRREK